MDNLDTNIPDIWVKQYKDDLSRKSFFDKFIQRIIISDWLKFKWGIKSLNVEGKPIKIRIV